MGDPKYYFFIEGETDSTFFIKLLFSISQIPNKGNFNFIKYSRRKKEDINGILKTLSDSNINYFFMVDFNSGPCVTSIKEKQKVKYSSLNDDNIFIVIKEIESWYLAGLDDVNSTKIGITNYQNTNGISKGKFEEIKPQKFDSIKDFSLEVLKHFSIETAKKKNSSFNYSWTKISAGLSQ